MTATHINRKSQFGYRARVLGVRVIPALALLSSVSFCLAQSDLIRLIPPDAPVIAGMRRLPHDEAKDALWLATRNNTDDLARVVALTADDPERRVEQVIAADWAAKNNSLGSHLLLAEGRFNFANVSSTVLASGGKKLVYNGVPVLTIEATGTAARGTRWLAVPRNNIAIFGSPSAVQYALDRYRSSAQADPQILQRLRNAHAHDAAWSSVRLDSRSMESRVKLVDDGGMSSCLGRLREFDLGIRLGETVRIDLHADPLHHEEGSVSIGCLNTALFGNGTPQMRVAVGGEGEPGLRVTLAREEYDRWLDSFRKSKVNQTLEAMISMPGDSR